MTPEDLFRTFQRDQASEAINRTDFRPVMQLLLSAYRAAIAEGATHHEAALLSGAMFGEMMRQARNEGGDV